MRITVFIFLFFVLCSKATSQKQILYDLDSYIRVDVDLRATQFSPDAYLYYDKHINSPGTPKFYSISVGGEYIDTQQINNEKRQKSIYRSLDLDLRSGTSKKAYTMFNYNATNRIYDEMNYFKNGWNVSTDLGYYDQSSFIRYEQNLNVQYDIGFGFGRLEVINNAWIGARILEELKNKDLLELIPDLDEMKLFFDLIGNLEYERVLDIRLRSMYIVENIIDYIEEMGWIEKGSVPAFLIIYDAYRYENFIFRQSGERLEFTLSPELSGVYKWWNSGFVSLDNYIQPGFIGKIEFEVHRNGDLEFYTTKSYGGVLRHNERFFKDGNQSEKTYAGDLFFNYQFRYIPSLRTNISINTGFIGGFEYSNSYMATVSLMSSFVYRYYFSPSTQLELDVSGIYNDSRFQLGDYQPRISGSFRLEIIHAIR